MDNDGTPPGARAGWFSDPAGRHRWRRWDGHGWTHDVDDGEAPPDAGPAPGTDPTLLALPAPTGDPVPETEPADGSAPGPARRIGLVLLATVGLLAAAFLAGTAVGWQIIDQRAGGGSEDVVEPEIIEVRIPTFEVDGIGGAMPDVRGLEESVAREILADTVLRGEAPVVEYVPWAGQPGVVIEQRPAFGAIAPAAVQLTVAEQATVPDVTGASLDDIVAQLESLGSRVEVTRRFEDGVDTDVVLESDPPAGEPLPGLVTLVASERTASIFLASVDPVEGRCSRSEQDVDAERYPDALGCSASRDGNSHAWLLARAAHRLEGTIGLPDDGPTDLPVQISFYLDEEPVEQTVVRYGESIEISIETAGALRLRIDGRLADGDDATSFSTTFVLADLRLIGSADALTALRDGS